MPVDELVDAALAGLDQGETVTIPSLPDTADWDALEAAAQAGRTSRATILPSAIGYARRREPPAPESASETQQPR